MPSKRKISFTVINDLLYDQRMQKICNSLSINGYDVKLIGRYKINTANLQNVSYATKRIKCFMNKGKFFYLEYNIRLFFYLLFTKQDILSAIDCDTLWANYFVSRLKRKPLVYDAHELFSEVPEVIDRPKVQKFWKYTEQKLIPKTTARYTVCKSIANHFESIHNAPFNVVMNAPVFKDNIAISPVIEKDFILYQGALNEGRGLENLLIAMQQINSTLVIIGEGDISLKLKNMVKDLKIEDKVKFKGYLPPNEMLKYTQSAKIGINVSENKGLSYYYSLNNKFFDYIHCGLPAITNNFPEYKALNDQFNVGLLCEPEPKDMIEKINQLLQDAILYGNLEENCLLAARTLNWQAEEKKLIAIYDSI